jgi:hypothetical protein
VVLGLGYRDLVSFWNWKNGGRGDLVVQGSEKRGELGGCRCEGDEIVGRIRVGAGERGVCFMWLSGWNRVWVGMGCGCCVKGCKGWSGTLRRRDAVLVLFG